MAVAHGWCIQAADRFIYDFLDALVALRFLERDGDGADGRYRNTAETAAFLDSRSPRYIGGLLEMASTRQYGHWAGLTEALRTGQPQSEAKHTGGTLFDAMYRDFFTDSLPQTDVITMGNILHDWNLDQKMQLISSAYVALPDGGAFIVIENIIDDARRENVFGLMMSLNMLIEVGDGFDYTGADFSDWCWQVGFRRVDILPLGGSASAGIAYK